MKIYTCVEIDIESGKVLNEESFEYCGPVAECKGDSKAPQPSAEERALYRTQNDLLQQQLSETKTLTPMLMRQLGLKQVTTPEGMASYEEMTNPEKIASMPASERAALEYDMLSRGMDVYGNRLSEEDMLARMQPLDAQAYQANKLSNERYIKALKGELPISPALESELANQDKIMQETLSRKLGGDWMLSTAGQNAYSTMKQKADLVREEARRGEIDSASGRLAQGMATMQNLNAEKANDRQSAFGQKQTLISNMANLPGRTSGTMSQAGQMAGPYQQMREMQNNVNQQNAANKAAQTQGYVQTGVTVAAAAAAAY